MCPWQPDITPEEQKPMYEQNASSKNSETPRDAFFVGSLQSALQLIQPVFGPFESVFYPACNTDITPVTVFPEKTVTFLDPDQIACTVLRGAVVSRVLEIKLPKSPETKIGKHDLAILLNAHGSIPYIHHFIKSKGYLLAQGHAWNFDAESFIGNADWKMVAVCTKIGNNNENEESEISYITDNGTRAVCVDNGKGLQLVQANDNESLADYSIEDGITDLRRKKFKKNAAWYIFQKKW